MRWRCDYIDEHGVRCPRLALWRYQFHWDHPFDYADRCSDHPTSYWSQKTVLSQELPSVLKGLKQVPGGEAQTLHKLLERENNPICECSHLKISHDKNGCGAFSIGCPCVKKYEVLSEPITYKEILP